MLRRRFMQFLGLVPTIVPVHVGVLEQDGSRIIRDLGRDAVGCTAFMYGRVQMTGKILHSRNRKEFEERLRLELEVLHRDMMAYYDKAVAGEVPITYTDEKPTYINSLL